MSDTWEKSNIERWVDAVGLLLSLPVSVSVSLDSFHWYKTNSVDKTEYYINRCHC